jgi:prevent-host-death family protein
MTIIAADHARSDFDALLRRAAEGEEILITEHGKPLAKLVPAESISPPVRPEREVAVERVIEQLREHRKGNRLGPDLTIRQLIEEGRRC